MSTIFFIFLFYFYHFSFDTIEQTSAGKRIVWILFPATAHTTYIIQHFRINQKNLRIAPKIFLIIFLHRGYVLYNSLSLHCVYNFFKSGNVSTYYIVSFCSITFCCVCCVMADIYHDVLKFCINFFECPAETFAVL